MTDAEAAAIMARHARSFAPAARVLGRTDRGRVARLYALCRTVDDLADEDGGAEAAARLESIAAGVQAGGGADPVVTEASALFAGRPDGRAAFVTLVRGVRGDIGRVETPDMAALEAYAHAVAGTVGVMVASLFDVPLRWHGRAADLGCAMQLTNICRDVAEDAAGGRRYLPATLCPWPPEALCAPSSEARLDVSRAVAAVLDRADALYASGHAGLAALPLRLRIAVAIAAALYRGIGSTLRARGCDPMAGRVFVPPRRKLGLALDAVARLAWRRETGAPEEARRGGLRA